MLCLGRETTLFETNGTNVFYDSANEKVCTIRGNGAMGVTFKGLRPDSVIAMRLKDLGEIKAVKLSPGKQVASVRRSPTCVDFVFVEREKCFEFSQSVKSKTANIKQFEWISDTQIVFITDYGLELFSINVAKKSCKFLKAINVASDWSVSYHPSKLLLLATGLSSATLQPFVVFRDNFYRLKPFTVDYGFSSSKKKLFDRDVTVGSIYGSIYVIVPLFSAGNSSVFDINLYRLSSDQSTAAQLQYTLKLGLSGAFGVHVIDNLVIFHHLNSRSSFVFDVGMAPEEQSHNCVAKTELVPDPEFNRATASTCAMYSSSWVIIAPNVIIDPTDGFFSSVGVNIEHSNIQDIATRLQFIMNRKNSKELVLKEITNAIRTKSVSLRTIRQILSTLVEKATVADIPVLDVADASRGQLNAEEVSLLYIEQNDLIRMFDDLRSDSNVDKSFLGSTILAYVALLRAHDIVVQGYLEDIFVTTLLAAGEYAKLHQLLCYNVIEDSKPIAFLVLINGAKHAPLFQAGVDMYVRQNASNEILEILLHKDENITDALRYLEHNNALDKQTCELVLEKAFASGDRLTSFGAYSYCLDRKGKQVTSRFTAMFDELYSASEIASAEANTLPARLANLEIRE